LTEEDGYDTVPVRLLHIVLVDGIPLAIGLGDRGLRSDASLNVSWVGMIMEVTETGSRISGHDEVSSTSPLGDSLCKEEAKKRALGPRLASIYRTTAVLLLNTVLLFVFINLVIGLVHSAGSLWRAGIVKEETPLKYKSYRPVLKAVYPDLSPNEITELIKDTRRVPQVYDTYTQFREPAYQSKYINVTPAGFRDSKNQGVWPPAQDYYRVFIFGGSTTFGYGVSDQETIPSYLQEFLAAHAQLPIRVYNFGRCGYFSLQERVLLEKLLVQGQVPNLVVFIDGLNDFILVRGDPSYTRELTGFMIERDVPLAKRIAHALPLTRPFVSASFYSGAAQDQSSKDTASQPQPKEDELLRDVVKRYRINKEIVESICRGFNISPVFVWQPVPLYGYDQKYNIFARFGYDKFSPHVAQGYKLAAKVVKSEPMGDNFVWLADMQEGLKEPIYVDAFHYSAKMCQRIAQAIGTAIIERGLLQPKIGSNSRPNS
jgi:lysophospholipase L1-like esterase